MKAKSESQAVEVQSGFEKVDAPAVPVKEEKKMLTPAQAATIQQVFGFLMPDGLGVHAENLELLAETLMIAAEVVRKASFIHQDEQVSYAAMCWATKLPQSHIEMGNTVELLSMMLKPLNVEVKAPKVIKRGGGLPNFMRK